MRDWTCDDDYADVDRLDAAGLAWEFARRGPALRAALADPTADLARWGLVSPADPELTAEQANVWWRWDFAPGIVVSLVAARGSGATAAALRAAAVAREGERLRFPNGLQAELPESLAEADPVAAIIPLATDWRTRAAAAGALCGGLAGRWRAVPLPSRWRRARLRRMLRTLDGRAAGASYRDIAFVVLGERFEGSTAWRDASARGVAIRLAQAALELARAGYARFLRRRSDG